METSRGRTRNPRRWAEVLGTVLFVIAILNFSTFFIASLSLGGDALNGKIEDERYFLNRKGRYTEVSESVWRYSRIHAISVFATHAVGILAGGGLLEYSRRFKT